MTKAFWGLSTSLNATFLLRPANPLGRRASRAMGLSLVFFSGLLTTATNAHAAPSFSKGAHQFCISDLDAQQQSALYSRILSLGASFSHGCIACDSVKSWQGYTEMTDDQFWVRRNYLAHFFAQVPWKDPDAFRYEHLYILENDGRTKPTAMVPAAHLKRHGYTGEWMLDPVSGAFGFVSEAMRNRLHGEDGELKSEGAKVGGSYLQKGRMVVRPGPQRGVLLRTVPGRFASSGAQPRSVYDLSIDGGFIGTLFAVHGDETKAAELERSGWRDPALRDEMVRILARRLASVDPTLLITVDVLFWDTVFESVYRLRESGPQNPLIRLSLGILRQTPIGKQVFDQQRRLNQREDLFRALALVSRGFDGRAPVPVLLARLADDPIAKFREKEYMPVLATIFGQFLEQVTGANLIDELLFWLNKISVMHGESGFLAQDFARRPNGSIHIPGLDLTLSPSDVQELRATLRNIRSQLPPPEDELDLPEQNPGLFSNNSRNAMRFSFDPVGGSKVTLLPAFTSGIVGRILIGALVDLPSFVKGLDASFKGVNAQVTALTAATDNNVHELDVNEFYENLGFFLNPRAAHPSVLGATRMAKMVEKTTCGGRSL